jgi:cytochrome c oxidase cbb3-type subunit 3
MRRAARLPATMMLLLVVGGCEREDRRLQENPGGTGQMVSQVSLEPGPGHATDTLEGVYDDNAYGTSEGQTLFAQMNCVGCHSHGGGGMGPALMDDRWIYGSRPDQIYASIAEGRPNGMPTWKNRLTPRQIWQLVAYVRSLSGLTPKGARPTRMDHMMVVPAPAQTPNAKPKNSPPAAPPP